MTVSTHFIMLSEAISTQSNSTHVEWSQLCLQPRCDAMLLCWLLHQQSTYSWNCSTKHNENWAALDDDDATPRKPFNNDQLWHILSAGECCFLGTCCCSVCTALMVAAASRVTDWFGVECCKSRFFNVRFVLKETIDWIEISYVLVSCWWRR